MTPSHEHSPPTPSRRQSSVAKGDRPPSAIDQSNRSRLTSRYVFAGIVAVGLVAALVAFTVRDSWTRSAQSWLAAIRGHSDSETAATPPTHAAVRTEDMHAAGSHPGHDEANALALSPAGRKNVGLELVQVELRDFERTVTMPATIAKRPGRSQITVSAPMTGIITRVDPIRGEAVVPGQHLFDLRLTHEDLVEKQSGLLRDLQQLDVVNREVERLEEVTRSGAVAGRTLLERVYERQKLEAAINAARQALKLHGLDEEQIVSIVERRELLQMVEICAPTIMNAHEQEDHGDFLQLKEILVQQGDHVEAGTPLGTLSDHCHLYIEGQAFENDAALLTRVANQGTPITALIETNGSGQQLVSGLKILYIENEVKIDSRTLRFYVQLENELVRNVTTEDGHRFIGWKFRPGQRVDLQVPVEQWQDCLVLPVQAVVREGAESYVFQQNKDHFDRVTVHAVHRDQRWVVVEADGSLFPGDTIAGKGAYQIHLALKNKSGAAVDPHAGHNH